MQVVQVFLLVLGLLSGLPCEGADRSDKNRTPPPQERQLFHKVDTIPKMVTEGKLSPDRIPNPHWRDDACYTCHIGDPNTRPVKLRGQNTDQLCHFCHGAIFDHKVKLEEKMIPRMPATYQASLKRTGGKLMCVTCHDLPAQCLSKRRREKRLNSLFLRDGPFKTRTEQCYYCHDPKAYERLNPHDQMTDDGKMRTATCRLCHSEDIDILRAASGIENLDFYGERDLKSVCIRCHPWEPHPGGAFSFRTRNKKNNPNHLTRPKIEIMERIRQRAEESGVTLPLEPGTGKIFCATCHDPHEQGVINNNKKEKGKRPDTFLRTKNICLNCHDK